MRIHSHKKMFYAQKHVYEGERKSSHTKGGCIMRIRISKSFLRGYIRVIDFCGTKTWPDLSRDRERDYEKLRGDWEDVGRFIRESTESYGRAQG